MDNFSYSYFSGANISVIINVDSQDVMIDCAGLSYSVNYGNSPIFSYCSELFDAVLRGREMVQGSFILNHTSARNMSKLLNDAWSEELGISFLNARTFDFIIKFTRGKEKNLILKDCAIISRGQTIQIDSANILEEYNFVGREVLYSVEKAGKIYSEMKEVIKKRRKPFNEKTQANQYEPIDITKKVDFRIFEDPAKSSNAISISNIKKKVGNGGDANIVYARDRIQYQVKSPLNSVRANDENITKAFLQGTFLLNVKNDKNAKQEVKKMLAYMLDKERGTTLNNNNRDSLEPEELNTERAALLWVAANRMFIRKNKLDSIGAEGSDKENDILKAILNNQGWATYGDDYNNGKYDNASKANLDFVDNFLEGKYMNEIFVHTNFVHANDNLPSFPKWSLGNDQLELGTSAYEPVYIGNAVFSTGFNKDVVQKLREKYQSIYKNYYGTDNLFTIPYSERQ